MIGKLSGIIDSFTATHIIVDVQGVGYLVHASQRTLGRIGQIGDVVSLYIETAVREDAITLYGFADAAEQAWFKLLISVQGVGAKAGLAILSVCPPEKVGLAIAAQDKAMLTQADGVGPKLATRILTELKDKAANMELSPKAVNKSGMKGGKIHNDEGLVQNLDQHLNQDAVSALVNLGYARGDAYTAVMNASAQANDNLQALIRLALKDLSA